MEKYSKYSLLVRISQKMEERGFVLGKIPLHMLVFLLKKIYSVPVGYDFKLFTYGPYSVELTADLDYLFSSGILEIVYKKEGSSTTSLIRPGKNCNAVIKRSLKYLHDNEDKIGKAVNLFGEKDALKLEAEATIIYLIEKENSCLLKNENSGDKISEDKTDEKKSIKEKELIEKIQAVKPYLSSKEIITELNDLKKMKLSLF